MTDKLREKGGPMKALFISMLVIVACLFLACENNLPLGHQGIATCEWYGVYFTFNVPAGTLEARNNMTEWLNVRVLQYNEDTKRWYNIQGPEKASFTLVGTTQNGDHGRIFYRIPYEEGMMFELCVRNQGGDWETKIFQLVPETGSIQGAKRLLVVEIDPSLLAVQPPSMAELDLQ